MKFIEHISLAASLDAGGACTDCGFLDDSGLLSCLLRPFAGVCLSVCCVLVLLCRFVCQNRYRLVTDAVFENRLSVCVFAIELWYTICFLGCMPCMPPMRPILNYRSYSESEFVCHVCQKQIM